MYAIRSYYDGGEGEPAVEQAAEEVLAGERRESGVEAQDQPRQLWIVTDPFQGVV